MLILISEERVESKTMETVLVNIDKTDQYQTNCKGPSNSPRKGSANTNVLNSSDKAIALQNSRLQEKIKKQARTHSLLVSIVVVFASSWFPLNLLNVVLDVFGFMEMSLLVGIYYTFVLKLPVLNNKIIIENQLFFYIPFSSLVYRTKKQAVYVLLFVI